MGVELTDCGQGLGSFPGGSVVKKKNPPTNTGDVGFIPALGRSPAEGNGNLVHCVLACRILWTDEPGRLPFMESKRV